MRKLKKMNKADEFISKLKSYKNIFTKQQYKTLRGQALKGELEAAEKGLCKLLKRGNIYYQT
jgi:hypothetical protein